MNRRELFRKALGATLIAGGVAATSSAATASGARDDAMPDGVCISENMDLYTGCTIIRARTYDGAPPDRRKYVASVAVPEEWRVLMTQSGRWVEFTREIKCRLARIVVACPPHLVTPEGGESPRIALSEIWP